MLCSQKQRNIGGRVAKSQKRSCSIQFCCKLDSVFFVKPVIGVGCAGVLSVSDFWFERENFPDMENFLILLQNKVRGAADHNGVDIFQVQKLKEQLGERVNQACLFPAESS